MQNTGGRLCPVVARHRMRADLGAAMLGGKMHSFLVFVTHRRDLALDPKRKIYIQIGAKASAKCDQDVDRFAERSSADSGGLSISCDRSLLGRRLPRRGASAEKRPRESPRPA